MPQPPTVPAATTDPSSDEWRAASRGLVVTATMMLVGLLLAGVTQLAGVVDPEGARARLVSYRMLWPEGWSFFVGLADKQVIMAYPVGPAGVAPNPLTQRMSWTDQLAGLDRSGDVRLAELFQLAVQVPDQYWHECGRADPSGCASRSVIEHPFRLPNGSHRAGLCGLTAFAGTHPVPMTGGDPPAARRRVDKIAIVDLACAG
ncbi:hypothetical protein [Kutzneria sp. CA-103260]|uniref:hypothetical protein n=1 Tax=Kutzneria sp. CA-103260 TaxID=2802641 RepID=UPI001BA7A5EE|nr:hypothetical protein [Kutzneria sp. CA-103260]QUQ68993.1 Sporulation delaying protein SdpA [Kutzneria sp. CA-103260]